MSCRASMVSSTGVPGSKRWIWYRSRRSFCTLPTRSLEQHMTSGVTDTPRSGEPPAAGPLVWHTLGADQVLHSEGVFGQRGLSSAEAAARAERFGPNTFAAGQ